MVRLAETWLYTGRRQRAPEAPRCRAMKPFARLWNWFALGLLAVAPVFAIADDDPPGRAGRIGDMQGEVLMFEEEQGEWAPAVRNRPFTSGDRIATEAGARVELRIGSTTLRLGPVSELEVLRLDDERIRVQLHAGNLALRVRSRDKAEEIQVVTDEVRLQPLRSGHYRIDRNDDSTWAAAWRGSLRVEDREDGFTIETGRRAELWREGGDRRLQRASVSIPDDEFGDWVAREDRQDERNASRRYVSPEMTGAEDLDRYGRWEQHPEYGALWTPIVVSAGWAPYRHGRWVWVRPWGWTWVDEAPWGFAPFHYGRWVHYRGRWSWTPGSYVARPVYAPALVAWVGGANFNVSISIGGPLLPAVGWVPLAPREVFVPYYRHTPVYVGRVNHAPPGRPLPQPRQSEPIMYGNQGVPNAVTVVPRDVLQQRQPVARSVVDLRDNNMQRPLPVVRTAPVERPQAAAPVVSPAPGTRIRVPPSARTPGSPGAVVTVPGGTRPTPRDDSGARNPSQIRRDEQRAVPPGQAPAQQAPGVVDLRQRERAERERPDAPAARPQQPSQGERVVPIERQNTERQNAERQAQQQREAQQREAQQRETQQREAAERAQREQREQRERPRAPVVVSPPAPQQQVQPVQRPRPPEREEPRVERNGNERRDNPRERDVR